MIRRIFEHPLAKGHDLDDPYTTKLRRQIIHNKRFLTRIYNEWYEFIISGLPPVDGYILEIGTGAGFFKDKASRKIANQTLSSEVFFIDKMDVILNGEKLPFKNDVLRSIFLIDVFHHIPNCEDFLYEASRVIKPGGTIIMVEPWVSTWSKLIYAKIHHEPFEPNSETWSFPKSGPLSGANGALPWIVFYRDLDRFNKQYSNWNVFNIEPMMPFSYIISGGVSLRSLAPGWCYPLIRWIETIKIFKKMSMFAGIILKKANH